LQDDKPDCSQYYCISKDLDKNFKKISKSSYKKLKSCDGLILDGAGTPCGKDKCYLDAGEYWDKKVEKGSLLKGGFLADAGDTAGGAIGLVISLVLLSGGLIGLCTLLKLIFMSKAKTFLKYAIKLNDYLAMLIGVGVTIIVQSSSVTTSALTPLCGVGVLPIEKMLPLTLGANIGTTCTALIASLVSLKFNAVQIALCHFFFNVTAILIWFPLPLMRNVPLSAARLLGLYASFYRWLPAAFIFVAFVLMPGICLLVSTAIDASVVGGILLLFVLVAAVAAFEFVWWVGYPVGEPLCYKVLSPEQRAEGMRDLAAANAALVGDVECGSGEAAADPAAEATAPLEEAPVTEDAAPQPTGEVMAI